MSTNPENESHGASSSTQDAPKPQVETIRLPTVEEMRGQDIWNNCAIRSVVSGVMGGGLGLFMGLFLGALDNPIMQDEMTGRQQFIYTAKQMGQRSWSSCKTFAVMGFIFSAAECVIEKARAKHDITNTVVAGCVTGGTISAKVGVQRKSCWYEEEIEENLRWCFALNSILYTGVTQYQDIQLLDTKPFGKALVIDGKLQSAEIDEFVYHESLVHPPLLTHPNPKTIFIMGGGEGSTAREILRHKTVQKLVMCDIDQEVVEFCKSYLEVNTEAFCDPRLELIINDARAELERREELYDVIIGDLADPIEGGPCYQLYTKSFYEFTVKPRLNKGGIFVTQAGPAGIFSHTEVFSCIYNTLRQVFSYVVPYSAHIPSYADTWGWIMASDFPLMLNADELDLRIKERIKGENKYIDGKTFTSASTLNKAVRNSLDNETHVYTEGNARFIYGHGTAYKHN